MSWWGLLQEQQQLCAALQETKSLLEEQLADARTRCSSLRELERDNLLLRQRLVDVEAVGALRCFTPSSECLGQTLKRPLIFLRLACRNETQRGSEWMSCWR